LKIIVSIELRKRIVANIAKRLHADDCVDEEENTQRKENVSCTLEDGYNKNASMKENIALSISGELVSHQSVYFY